MKKVGHKCIPEFIEEEFISAVETVISNAVYPRHFIEISRVSQDEEHGVGYDGVINSFVPFYLQFKRSTFHTPQFDGKTAKDRAACGYGNRNGFFSFTLHKDRVSKGYDQHNKLFALQQQFSTAYVAPLFYRKNALSQYKLLTPGFAWSYQNLNIATAANPRYPVALIDVRIFHETMTIPPHAPVTDHLPSHEYSYSHNGDICFHSKATPTDGPRKTLYDLLAGILHSLVESQTPLHVQSLAVIEMLPKVFSAEWKSRLFRSMLKSYMVELDILPAGWNGDLPHFLSNDLGTAARLMLSEAVLWGELRIAQYVARIRKA